MAETALGMATTLVGSALGVALSAAREEMGLLLGVQDDIWFISNELKMMQAFLRAADGARENIGVLKAYSELIRDLAYDIEDRLEEFMVFVKHKNLCQQLLSLRERHRIAVQIKTLKLRVQEVSQMNKRYNAINLTPSTSSNVIGDTEFTRNFTALNVEESQLVGLDEPKKKLMELIAKLKEPKEHETSNAGPRVVSLVGMGGLGKTALAKKVFDSKDLSDMFGTRAWITVSQSFDQKEIFKEMVKQLFGVESLNRLFKDQQGQEVTEANLAGHISKELQEKRYLIVLDDVWTIDAWNRIKVTFQCSGKDDSCVVVTTRNHKLAEYCSPPSHIHQPEFLGKEEARTLFLKKTKRSLDDLEKGDKTKGIVEKILHKCGGLPLAILTIGALLANKDTEEWESIYKQLPWDLATNPSLDALRRVVSLSYNHLPWHLKPCFLHLSIFPEDFEIERKHLVNRWVAEGLVADDTSTRTLEEVAENYFYELISRCMIQPSKLDNMGKVKTCRIHDIVHDIAVSISKQENYAFIHGEHTSNIATRVGIRHLSCVAFRKLNIAMDLSCVRSLTVFSEPPELASLLCSSKFKMLRILDLKHAQFAESQQDIKYMGLLVHLKYLHFPLGSNIYTLPRSIGNLLGLQTLDIRKSKVATLPTEITKLHNLRSLRCSKVGTYVRFDTDEPGEWFKDAIDYLKCDATATADLHMAQSSCWSTSSGIKLPRGVRKLKELQILEKVDIKRTSRKAIKELGELTQLRKIVVTGRGASKKKCKAFCKAVPKLSTLRSLSVSTKEWRKEADVLDKVVSFTSSLPSLERLKLKGLLQKIPAWVGKCDNLVKVDLKYCQLKELEYLAELPNLVRLRLKGNAFNAEKLVFREHGFPKLRIFLIQNRYGMALTEVTFEQSTSPNMETIDILDCNLTTGINGINHLPKLKKISILYGCLGEQGMLQEEVENHTNHPVLQMLDVSEPR
ncbi:unnamed protein product [Miscanthus lutarioriparius]|uniref:Uncharacterized protein n=1 Tax=Miscanthus lutarioriparius TaxID=422564 RepID=A0A811SGA6_9POAL|nr:unnamed protein product [Miscanthus lutarioriparius]